jgi:hypothetical protein
MVPFGWRSKLKKSVIKFDQPTRIELQILLLGQFALFGVQCGEFPDGIARPPARATGKPSGKKSVD